MQTIKITITNPNGANIVLKELRPNQKEVKEKLQDLLKQVAPKEKMVAEGGSK